MTGKNNTPAVEFGFSCSCCGYLTIGEPDHASYEICPVCGWEDDPVQHDDPNFSGGANKESLREAQTNYKNYGAINRDKIDDVRSPLLEEIPNK